MSDRENKFFSILERIRHKPKAVRQAYALGTAAGITALLAVVWVGTIMTTGAYPGITQTQRQQFAAVHDSSADRLNMFKNEFAKQMKDSPERAQVNELITQLQQQQSDVSATTTSTSSDSDIDMTQSSSSDPYGTNY